MDGAEICALDEDIAARALLEARAHGLRTHLIGHPRTLAGVPALRELAHATSWTDAGRWKETDERVAVVLGVGERSELAAAEIAATLGVPGNDPDAVRRVRDQDGQADETPAEHRFSVHGVFLGGEPHALAVAEHQIVSSTPSTAVGHVLPATAPHGMQRETQAALDAARASGLRFGVFHAQLRHDPGGEGQGPVVDRVGLGTGGDWLHVLLAHAIPGLELFGLVCDDALGRRAPSPLPVPVRAAAMRFLVAPPGRLVQVDHWERLLDHPAVLRAELAVHPGSVIRPGDRAGMVIVGADTPDEAGALAGELAASVAFSTDISGTDSQGEAQA